MTRRTAAALAVSFALGASAWGQDPTPPPPTSPPPPEASPAAVPVAAPAPAPVATPAPEAAATLAHPNAGYGNDVFYLRSDDDNFILIPSGRLQYDWYGYQGGSKEPFNTFNPKRIRLEAFGTFMHHWDFQMGAEFTNSTNPIFTDDYIVANYTRYANVQVGQFDAPFTMENRTSDKYTDLQERATPVRGFAIPDNKEIGAQVFGQPEGKWAYWSAGIFNGEGLQQLPHRSNNFDFMGRGWIAPFGLMEMPLLKNVWVGGSFWEANRAPSVTNQLDRLAMKDSAGFTFFNPASGALHTGNYGQLNKYGVELNAPIGPFVLKAEYITSSEALREVTVAAGANTPACGTGRTDCTAVLSGDAYYIRLSYFVWGDNLINGLGGTQNMPHLFGQLTPGKTGDALQLVAEYDRTGFTYAANDGSTSAADPFVGGYFLSTWGFGANYWYTKRVRVTGNFLFNTLFGPGPKPLITSNHSYEFTLRAALVL